MNELIYTIIGAGLGIAGLLSIQWLYSWIAQMRKEVDRVKWELDHYRRMSNDWTEFNFWKNEQKKQ